MKLIILSALWFYSCNNTDDVKSIIPGIYVAAWSSEFAESRDTIVINQLTNRNSEIFSITRRRSFYYKGKGQKPEYKVLQWKGGYNEKQKTISVHNSGRVLQFGTGQSEMIMGSRSYKKL